MSLTIYELLARSKIEPRPLRRVPQPTFGDFPTLKGLIDGLAWLILLGCLVAILVSTIVWNIGSKTQNQEQTFNGKRGVVVGVFGALLVGGIPWIIRFFVRVGSQINP